MCVIHYNFFLLNIYLKIILSNFFYRNILNYQYSHIINNTLIKYKFLFSKLFTSASKHRVHSLPITLLKDKAVSPPSRFTAVRVLMRAHSSSDVATSQPTTSSRSPDFSQKRDAIVCADKVCDECWQNTFCLYFENFYKREYENLIENATRNIIKSSTSFFMDKQ